MSQVYEHETAQKADLVCSHALGASLRHSFYPTIEFVEVEATGFSKMTSTLK